MSVREEEDEEEVGLGAAGVGAAPAPPLTEVTGCGADEAALVMISIGAVVAAVAHMTHLSAPSRLRRKGVCKRRKGAEWGRSSYA